MKPAMNFYPPKVARASRATGPRIETAPNNKDSRTGCGGECQLPTDQSRPASLAHDTTEASRAVEVVPGTQAAEVPKRKFHLWFWLSVHVECAWCRKTMHWAPLGFFEAAEPWHVQKLWREMVEAFMSAWRNAKRSCLSRLLIGPECKVRSATGGESHEGCARRKSVDPAANPKVSVRTGSNSKLRNGAGSNPAALTNSPLVGLNRPAKSHSVSPQPSAGLAPTTRPAR